ncbi:MAG: flagellar basal-body MS-ring/collar protein FliF [Woeseiaceae bacterium]|nr:flagellar basal-body MS-ring/collar protein FliF [Woeseiaceae bacterium]
METGTVIESTAVDTSQLNLASVLRIPAVRQIMLLIGVAAAVAVGFAVVLWSQSPGYRQLYGDLGAPEATAVADALQSAGIDHKIGATGAILVAEAQLHAARLELASQGLPNSTGTGMDLMQEQSSFGVSQFMENARYQHALEAELARTISSLGAVREARVHLALPKQSAFIRDNKGASASVLLHLFGGMGLEADQASAVVHLVASSVPNLHADDVTLIDQHGRLLSSGAEQAASAQAATQFKYSRQLEDTYKKSIEDILTPLVGVGRVRAEVSADIDFTYTEETSEIFDPNRTVVRSEQTSENQSNGSGALAAGVPGALSNQPPEAAEAQPVASEQEQVTPRNSSRSSTRNYEVDRTIRHTRPQSGAVRRLSVAVLIDDTPVEGEDAQTTLSESDIERYTELVKQAVGFNEARGDTVVVLNEAFRASAPMEEVAPPPLWERPALVDAMKQILGAILVLAIAFGIVRPLLRNVLSGGGGSTGQIVGAGGELQTGGAGRLAGGGVAALSGPSYDEKVAAAKNLTGHDPARVAQVVKRWIATDE